MMGAQDRTETSQQISGGKDGYEAYLSKVPMANPYVEFVRGV
jgi:hypothetical protein